MKRVFILGATGYIGSHLAAFLRDDFEVVTLGRKNSDVIFDLESNNFDELVDKINANDTLVFLSAISAPDLCEKNYEYAFDINVRKTILLTSMLLEKKVKVIFSSSDAVFGNAKNICDERDEKRPFGKYGQMKSEVEDYFHDNNNFFVTRFSYVLGKGDKFTLMIDDYYNNGKTLAVFDGFERSVIMINDVLSGIRNIITNWEKINTRVVNFSGNSLVSRQDIVTAIVKEKYHSLSFKFIDAPESFWQGRPKKIHTKSIFLESIINRSLESYLAVCKE
ncbi:NAD-dependent dehydratase [Izhakiella australiensis]|uniref:NAD-dependent dehydratase n=1 Tax=Izhakiella australiensis TaxID=1926881 RepID=A0A1S8Y9Y0_9GAMM|nr:sugar nucleotide-binding protein [Izhakiella australiensis]OON35656.1 NAD-dependent dehydratase [Izhakiella australiensis]